MYPVKQSTALDITFFAFDSNGDGVTGKVDGDWTKRISKNGGAFAAMTVTVTEMENGWYSLTLSTAHTDTLGILSLSFSATGVKRVNLQFRVAARIDDDLAYPTVSGRSIDVSAGGEVGIDWANIGSPTTVQTLSGTTVKTATDVETDTQDIQARLPAALVGGRMDSNMQAAANNVITAAVIADGAIDRGALAADTGLQTVRSNTAQAGAAGTITLDSNASASDDFYNDAWVFITGGTGAGQARLVSDYVGATKVASVTPNWVTNPDNTSTFAILPAGRVDVGQWLDGTPNALVSGRLDASVGAMANDVVTSAAIATDAIGSAELSQAAADKVWSSATRTLTAFGFSVTVGTNNDKTGYGLSSAAIQAIWDALTSALTTAGSIGKLLVDNINATIGSRSSHTAADVWAHGTRSLTDKAGFAIASGGIGAGAHTAAELNAIADALLDRNMATGTDSGTDSTTTRTVRQALRRLRNREAIAGGTGTVYKENDTDASWTYAATTAAGNPLTEVNPT